MYFRELEDESSDEDETEMDMETYTSATKGKHDLMIKNEVGTIRLGNRNWYGNIHLRNKMKIGSHD